MPQQRLIGTSTSQVPTNGMLGTLAFMNAANAAFPAPVSFSLGSAAAPSIAFTGDPNTGIYSPGADQVAISTGGSGRLFVNSSGRVLVGTDSARTSANGVSAGLQVEGTGAESAISIIRNGGLPYLTLGRSGSSVIGSNAIISNGDELGRISWAAADGTDIQSWAAQISAEIDGTPGSNDTPGRLILSTTSDGNPSPTERLRIDSSGNVGIGTSSFPYATAGRTCLDISGSSTSLINIKYGNTPGLVLESLGASGAAISAGGTTLPLIFYTNATERLRITSAGLVGVGTSSPSAKLTITDVSTPYIRIERPGVTTWQIQNNQLSTEYGLSVNNITSGTTPFFIGESGRVGIGTTSATTLLDVNGDIRLRSSYSLFLGAGAEQQITSEGLAGATSLVFKSYSGSYVERARIDSSGRLGIGTSLPGGQLTVYSAGNQVRVESPTASNADILFRENGVTNWTAGYVPVISAFRFSNGSSDVLTLTNTGRVGVGSASPTKTLEVVKSSSGGTVIQFTDNANAVGRLGTPSSGVVAFGGNTDHNIAFGGWASDGNTFTNERCRLTSSGQLLVGTSTARSVGNVTAPVEIEGTTYATSSLSITCNSTSDTPLINLGRSKGASLGSVTGGLVANDELGYITFGAADGSTLNSRAAWILCQIDGATGTTDVPGRLVFSTTADGAASPTERMRITSTGQVRLAGAGITFNGDTAAANELDDYEEGTFSPTLQGLSAAGTVSYLRNNGRYTKIGNIVHITVDIKIDTVSVTPTGGLVFAALPFTSANVEGNFVYPGAVRLNAVSLPAGSLAAYAIMLNNSTIARIQTLIDNAAPGSIDGSNIAANDELQWSCTYRTA